MASPLATEKVLRATLQVFQRGGIIASGSDVAKLEQVPNNATDADISAILDTIVFGSALSSGASLASEEDIDIFIDSNNDDGPLTNPRYFRVSQDQAAPPVTDPNHELLTVTKSTWSPSVNFSTLTVGPRYSITGTSQGALINVGASSVHHYGQIVGASGQLIDGETGLSIRSNDYMDFRTDDNIMVGDKSGNNVCGGWENLATKKLFHVGDFTPTPKDSLAIESEYDGVQGYSDFTIRPAAESGQPRCLFIRGSASSANYHSHTIIGGKAGEAWADPSSFTYPTLMVVGNLTQDNGLAYFYERRTLRDPGTSVVTIDSAAAENGAKYYHFRILGIAGIPAFNVDSTGTANCPGGYVTGPADLAETVVTDVRYNPGTVIAIQSRTFTQTTDYGQTNVAGVITTDPGIILGTKNRHDRTKAFLLDLDHDRSNQDNISKLYTLKVRGDVTKRIGTYIGVGPYYAIKIEEARYVDGVTEVKLKEGVRLHEGIHFWGGLTKHKNLNRLAVCGIVPVLCSTERGDILGNGETLISGPDGVAVVDPDPKPGTIIGKAKGQLIQTGETAVKGLVETLVNLQ